METWKRSVLLLVAFSALLFGTRAYSAQSCTLVLPGVQGESTVIPGGIDVMSFSSGLTQPGSGVTGRGGGADRARFQDFQITKKIDKSSPVLFENTAAGHHYSEATLYCSKPGAAGASSQFYLVFDFKVVAVKSIDWSGPSDGAPTEQVTFDYGSLRITYRPQNPDGALGEPVSRCWDVITNRSC